MPILKSKHIIKNAEQLDQESELIEKAREGMADEEAQFSVQHELEKQSFLWSDKYRPRKPRFFNRVHTGFEWNKYNQTHYDIDNPPPKIIIIFMPPDRMIGGILFLACLSFYVCVCMIGEI